jgi:hypothetical protein
MLGCDRNASVDVDRVLKPVPMGVVESGAVDTGEAEGG